MKMHKPLVSAAALANQGWEMWFTQGGGWAYKRDSPVADKVRKLLEQESLKEEVRMLPIWEESGVYNFYLYMGQRSKVEEAAALQKKESKNSGEQTASAPGFHRPPQV